MLTQVNTSSWKNRTKHLAEFTKMMHHFNKEHIHIRQVQSTLANGKGECDMEQERCNGQTMHAMKVNGNSIKPVERVSSYMHKEMFTMVNGPTAGQMALEFTQIIQELVMKANGRMTNNMVKEWKAGKKVLGTKENILKV